MVTRAVRPPPPPVRACLRFYRAKGLSIPTAHRFPSNILLTYALALSASQCLHKKTPTRNASMHLGGGARTLENMGLSVHAVTASAKRGSNGNTGVY